MSLEIKFRVAQITWLLIPTILPLLLVRLLPHPRLWRWRAPAAALTASLTWIAFTTAVYYPLYVAESWSRDVNPYIRFDSDALNVIKYVYAWTIPASVVALAAVTRTLVHRFARPASVVDEWSSSRVVGDF